MNSMPKLSEIKSWNPEIEKQITGSWRNSNNWKFNPNTKKKIYSIDTPPPYVNAPVHIGHAITYCYMDFFARYRRLKGFEVLFPIGLDRNGLPIELAAEKKFNISPFKISRDEFINYCKKILEQTSSESLETFASLGISFNSYRTGKNLGDVYYTDSESYRALTQSTFATLFRAGLIYEDKRINNFDTKLQTTVADSEIEYNEIPTTFNFVKWKVKETGETIIIATTRPELICSAGAVIFNPEDERYQNLNGKTAISPIYGKEIPIMEHPFAKKDKGTGAVMMCAGGDLTDNQFFREKNIPAVISINKEGRMNENSGFLQGLKVKEARERIIKELKSLGLLEKQEKIMHKTPVSERSGAEIEFIEMPEFYLKQIDFKNELIKISNSLSFFPEESKNILLNWIDSVSIDWPISRRRFYATPIPLWHSEPSGLIALPVKYGYYEPWKEPPPKDSEVFQNGKFIGKLKDFSKTKWNGETRVFDTWFDSSISELNLINYPSEFSKKAFPVSLRPQGKEIIRTWLYYTLLRGYLETTKPVFKDIWIHQHILDEKGRKMSKSLGNTINPQEIIKSEGSEALRLWAATEGDLSKSDLSCSREKIKAEQKTLNKLLNIARFILQFKKPKTKPKNLAKTDKLFIDCIESLTEFCDKSYQAYDFYNPAVKLRHFLWNILASNYLELIKNRAYNEQNAFAKQESASAVYTLYFLLERLTFLLHPIIPQLTSIIASELKISLKELPKAKRISSNLSEIEKIMQFNSKIWKKKKESGLSLRSEITGIKIPKSLKPYEKDLKACHNLK